MQDNSGFYLPLNYQAQWLWLGLAIVLAVIAWYAWILWPVRAPKSASKEKQVPPSLAGLRSACLAAIEATVMDSDAGRLPERAAHQKLSALTRGFAGSATGLPVTSMTLAELREHKMDHLAWAIEGIYPNEFAPAPPHTVAESADAARKVVLEWS
ncbi:hypothetical protein [Paenarthrobacter ilicis]|uniref:hypothetical protein n=1 Tax=Paenarthrobacter ilicis TaxID=43665 RepID=UPI00386B156C